MLSITLHTYLIRSLIYKIHNYLFAWIHYIPYILLFQSKTADGFTVDLTETDQEEPPEDTQISHYENQTNLEAGITSWQPIPVKPHETDITVNSRKPSYSCHVCHEQFDRLHFLNRHMTMNHADCVYKCDICSAQFPHRDLLENHQMEHSKEGVFKCDHCAYTTRSADELKNHNRLHFKRRNETNFICEICGDGFFSSKGYKNHKIRKHSVERPFMCDVCGLGFPDITYFNRHKVKHV